MTTDAQNPPDPRLLWLTPEAATNLAYALHDSQDAHSSPQAKGLSFKALRALEALDTLDLEVTSRHYQFLAETLTVITSYGNALTHLKNQRFEERKASELYLKMREDQLGRSQSWSAFWHGAFKVAGASAMGYLAYAASWGLSIFGIIPEKLLSQTGHVDSIFSIGFGVIVGTLTGLIQNWWSNLSSNRMTKEHNDQVENSHKRYTGSQQVVLNAIWEKLCVIRKRYTGEDSGDVPTYMRVLISDLDFGFQRSELLREAAASNIVQLCGIAIRTTKEGVSRLRKRKVVAPPAQ